MEKDSCKGPITQPVEETQKQYKSLPPKKPDNPGWLVVKNTIMPIENAETGDLL